MLGRAEDEPEPRRRGSGEAGRAFPAAARNLLRRAGRIPAEAYAATTAWLSDTLDWLNMWEANSLDDGSELDDSFNPQQDRYFPHP